MFHNLFSTHTQAGLVFSDQYIRLVLFKGNPDDLSRLLYWQENLQPGIIQSGKVVEEQAFIDQLKTMVRALGAKGRPVSFEVPETQLVLRKFELPGLMEDSDLQNYFFLEIGKKIQLPFDKPVFDFHTISRAATGTQAILFASPEPVVRRYQQLLRAAGLDPVSAEFSALGIERWMFHQSPEINTEHRMYAQLEEDTLTVSFFDHEAPLFVRQINLAHSTHGSDQEKLNDFLLNAADEIGRMVNFYHYSIRNAQSKLTKIYLLCGNPSFNPLKKILADAQNLPVSVLAFDPERTDVPDDLEPVFIPAVGLAMKEIKS